MAPRWVNWDRYLLFAVDSLFNWPNDPMLEERIILTPILVKSVLEARHAGDTLDVNQSGNNSISSYPWLNMVLCFPGGRHGDMCLTVSDHNFWNQESRIHYNDVIMGAIASQITNLTIVYSIVYSDADQRNIKDPRHWPLCVEFTGDRWIPRTNGQLRGKCFHLMTSSWL